MGDTKTDRNRELFTNRQLIAFILPLMVTLALQLVVGMVDSLMVSSVGEAAVSGVSLVDSMVQLIIYVFSAMAAGGAIVAGQYLGNNERERARKAAGELMWLNGAISLGITVLMLLFSNWLLTHLFGSIEPDVYYHAKRYMDVVNFSLPAIAIFEAGSAIFRTMNDSKTTMKLSFLMNVMNVAGNAALIYGFSMGTQGAAISTLASRWTAAAIVLVLLLNEKRPLALERTLRHRFEGGYVKRILLTGVPNGLENGIFQFGKIALLGLVTTFGTSAITANAVTQTLASIEVLPGSAVQLAAVTVIAMCVGRGDEAMARRYNRKLLLIAYVGIAAFCALFLLALPLILSLYGLTDETASLAKSMFLWHTLGGALLWPLAFDLPASLRAAGDVRFPMVISVLSMWVFRYGGAYLLAKGLDVGPVGVWIAMAALDWGFRAIVYVFRWRGGKWREKRVI